MNNVAEYLGWQVGVDFPEWGNNESYVTTISKGYLLPNETPRDAYRRVSRTVANKLNKPELEDKFFDYIWRGHLCLASPVLSNTGTTRGLPISCFGIDSDDSIESIANKNREMMVMAKNGGGVGISVSRIRPSGSPITDNGTSSGIVPFCKMYDSTILATNQGGIRKGALVINLDIEHPDFDEWLVIREGKGDINRQCNNVHLSAIVSDSFMRKVEQGNPEARRKWSNLLKQRKLTGEPYIVFIDAVNRDNPPAYKNNNLKVSMTNLCCLAGDTPILTKEGIFPIQDLVGEEVTIWDGRNWVENNSFELVDVSPVWKITLKNGQVIKATNNHKWYIANLNRKSRESMYIRKYTDELKPGDLLESHNYGSSNYGSTDKGFYIVESVEETNEVLPVYCTNVKSTGKFALANGVMTGNSEITLYTDPDHSFVCCLSSLNLAKYDEWDDDLVKYSTYFLDGVLQEFIDRAKEIPGFENAVRFSEKSRAIGLGVLGWNTFLQQEGLPFYCKKANVYTFSIFNYIKEESHKASKELALIYGEPEWCKGTGYRNSHTTAVAPTVSNSKLSGCVSPGIEPWAANVFSEKTDKGTFCLYNSTLDSYLKQLDLNTVEIWKQIRDDEGSVQGIKELDNIVIQECVAMNIDDVNPDKPYYLLKDVFKTFKEINQIEIVRQQGIRQQYVDQAVSLNLKFPHNAPPKFINDVHMEAWKMGLKTLYYFRSESVLKADVSQLTTVPDCTSCDG